MKITCTLSEYTKMARQCGENKARFNCRTCPLNGVADLAKGESCDIERFMMAISIPESKLARELAKVNGIPMPTTEVPDGCLHVVVPRPTKGGGPLETR